MQLDYACVRNILLTVEKWSHTQAILSKIGGASLKVISAVAEGVTTSLANKYLPTEIGKIIS